MTTEVIGVDGNSYAPFDDPADLAAFVELNAGLDGRPDIAYDWDTVAAYLSRFDRQVSVNIAYLVGNSVLRIAALGWADTPADARAVARMRALLREAMDEGAFGLSSGLDYPPGAYATTAELAALTDAGRPAAASTTPTSAIRWATATSTRSARPSRSAGWAGRRPTSPTSTTGRPSPPAPGRCWTWSMRRARPART